MIHRGIAPPFPSRRATRMVSLAGPGLWGQSLWRLHVLGALAGRSPANWLSPSCPSLPFGIAMAAGSGANPTGAIHAALRPGIAGLSAVAGRNWLSVARTGVVSEVGPDSPLRRQPRRPSNRYDNRIRSCHEGSAERMRSDDRAGDLDIVWWQCDRVKSPSNSLSVIGRQSVTRLTAVFIYTCSLYVLSTMHILPLTSTCQTIRFMVCSFRSL